VKITSNIRQVLGRLRRREPEPAKWQKWSIGIYAGKDFSSLSSPRGLRNPVLSADSVTDAKASFVADPFMIRVGGIWRLFFELMNSESGRGEIGVASSRDGVSWTYNQVVLREPFHLSYPYVFQWEGDYYMIPETHQANAVRLYKATEFPTKWTFVKDLLTGNVFEDSSIFLFNEKWWLLTDLAIPPYWAGTLRVFYADVPTGPWTEHPMSPVLEGNPHITRPAGRVVVQDKGVIRFTQDCRPVYGSQVRAFEITELTPTAFRERQLQASPILTGSGKGWNKGGMHHIDPHVAEDGQWIACVDGWYWEYR
jgi:hypothetical protein